MVHSILNDFPEMKGFSLFQIITELAYEILEHDLKLEKITIPVSILYTMYR